MDPNEALRLVRESVGELVQADDDDTLPGSQVGQLVEAFTALDEWLGKGGFLPDAWNKKAVTPDSPAARTKVVLTLMEHLNVDIDDVILWGHIDTSSIIGTPEAAFNTICATVDIHEGDNDMHAYTAQADAVNDALEEAGLRLDDEIEDHEPHEGCTLHAHVYMGQRLVHEHPHAGPHGYFGHDEDGMPEEPGYDTDTPYIDLSITEE